MGSPTLPLVLVDAMAHHTLQPSQSRLSAFDGGLN
jgi:hypothetical protein